MKLDAARHLKKLDAVEFGEEVELPPRAAKFAVGGELQSDLFLLLDRIAGVISPCARFLRAAFSAGGRNRLPT
jgi:hypothetical protein